jgi:hypothetical protein
MTEPPDDIKIEMLRAALEQLLNVTMFKDHPIESQFAIDALNATKPNKEEGASPN